MSCNIVFNKIANIYRVRGLLGAIISASQYIGILIAYIVGATVPYEIVPYCMLVLPVIYIATIIFIPETPVFLLKTNRRKVSISNNFGREKTQKKLSYFRKLKNH